MNKDITITLTPTEVTVLAVLLYAAPNVGGEVESALESIARKCMAAQDALETV